MIKKVVLIDDEAAGLKLLKEYLSEYKDLIILGEANNGVDGIKIIEEFRPDLIFLDVQMPGMTGLELISRLDENPALRPNVIFSTAFDKYACEAFELNAVDYLLKPYTKSRFDKAIKKVLQARDQNFDDVERLTKHLIESNPVFPETILVQKGQKYITISTDDIIWIGAEKDYSVLSTADGKYLSNYGIGAMEEKLNGQHFLRIHRSTIINIRAIGEVFKYPSSYDIKMSNGDKVKVSRSYLDKIREIIF